jgi:hypothetical protein
MLASIPTFARGGSKRALEGMGNVHDEDAELVVLAFLVGIELNQHSITPADMPLLVVCLQVALFFISVFDLV